MRAKPLVIWGLLAGVFTLPATTLALGLGKLTVDSNLGQPLSAHVELTAAQKEELDSLSAKVADPSVYRDNNVQYPAALSRARVVIEQAPNGPPQLKVTTAQPVNEPYLDLIVEVNWATGRVVRNYTFLLDPPGTIESQAVAPSANVRTAPASRAARAEAQPSALPPVAAAPKAGAADTYTVRRGDTLSKIARTYKPDNVNLEQMLVALFRSNESAFDGRNMNRLRTGQILSIPPGEQAAGVTPTEAQQVVRVQAADWRAYRDRVAAAAPMTEGGTGRQIAGGKITTAVEDKAAPAEAGKDQLRVSREAAKGAGGAGVAAGAAQAEDSTAKEKALREANSRIAELEKTLKDMQRAVELKSQAMAELQKQAEAGKAKAGEAAKMPPTQIAQAPTAAPAPSMAAPPPAAAPAAVTPPAPTPAPQAKAPEAKAPEAKAPETKAAETKAPEPKAPEAKAPEAKAADTKAAESAANAEAKAAAAKAKAPPKPAPSFIEDLLSGTPMWVIIAAVLGIIALIAGLFAARRRTATKFEDSIISGTDIKTNTVFGSTGGGVVNTGDNSLSSDFSREGLGNIDTDEVDPIAEAEVYLAYGRDAQAEEILKEALKKDAQRQEIYLKLLEIHAQHNKPSAFETVATELYSVSGGQGEVWQKAMALGRQLDPANPLFSDAGGTPSVAAAEATGTEDAVASEPDTVPAASAQVYSLPTEPKAEAKPAREIDFSLDDDISLSPTSGHAPDAKTPAAILAGAAQEVAKSTRAPEPVARATPTATPDESLTLPPQVSFEPESIPKFDLDFNLEETSRPGPTMRPIPPAPAPKPSAPTEAEPVLAAVASAPPAPQLARPAAAIELDKLDLSFDPQRSTFEDPTPSVLDGQWHDAATKLDLAKAYQEMGDVEGAREILQEVLHEGDDQQKAEAQALLTKLA
jgi:pilus assembly protein FimV